MDKMVLQTELRPEISALIDQYTSSDSPFIISGNYLICPGFCDVHVHFREPGFSYKETIASGSRAAARGGFTTVMTMPNLNPVPDCVDSLCLQLNAIKGGAVVEVVPYGSITVGQKGEVLSDMAAMASDVCAFSDDGRGVQDEALMTKALEKASQLGKMIVAHCEDNSLLHGGYIHDGEYAKSHGHKGICSASEYVPVMRDLELVKRLGTPYHVCHVSTKESVDAIRKAKDQGVNVTAETGPHYLILTDADLKEEGRFKMNPPLRAEEDRRALVEGIADGTIDMIATDHAPHSAEEKAKGLAGSAFGVVGLETAFAACYTHLVKAGVIGMEKLVDLMAIAPRKRFGMEIRREDFTVFDLSAKYVVDPEEFLSMGKSTPFTGMEMFGRCLLTVCKGKIAYQSKE